MKILRILWYWVRLADKRWSMREIDPMHPDVPMLVVETAKLQDKLHRELQ